MPSLDHCVNNQVEMTTLTKTLEVFDTYKHREDKDSDEESFHLPLDDDESESKVVDPLQNGSTETEEDILNKFDSTPVVQDSIDAQLEDRLLSEEEEKKVQIKEEAPVVENGYLTDDEKNDVPEAMETEEKPEVDALWKIEADQKFKDDALEKHEVKEEPADDMEVTDTEAKSANDAMEVTDTEAKSANEVKEAEVDLQNGDIKEKSTIETENVVEEDKLVANSDRVDLPTEEDEQKSESDQEPSTDVASASEKIPVEKESAAAEESAKDEVIVKPNTTGEYDKDSNKSSTNEEQNSDKPPMEDTVREDKPSEATSSEVKLSEDTSSETKLLEHTSTEDKLLEHTSTEDKLLEDTLTEDKLLEDTLTEDKLLADTSSKEKPSEETPSEEKSKEKPEEKSDDFPKDNEDSEDLFDISIIRDAEEDNAENDYNEAHPEENHEDQEEFDDHSDEKMEEECATKEDDEEEMDIDKTEEHLKHDDVDIEEDNLNCDATKDVISDGESDNSTKTLVTVDDKLKTSETADSAEKSETQRRLDEVTGNMVDEAGRELICADEAESGKNNEDSSRSSLKRPLSDESDTGPTKKSRTDVPLDAERKQNEKPKEKLPLKTLLTLTDFMKSRKHNKRLTMHDLEEFCVQKICEVIVHKSELGDVHHQLKQQEQLIESMRKEIQQLTKQARDLEIVNKKLMNDLKQQTTTQKPLSPLKITRSVGLQVKFTPAFEANLRKRQPNAPQTPNNTKGPHLQTRTPRVVTSTHTSAVNRQVSSPQKAQQVLPKPNTPLLSQALQNRQQSKPQNQVVRPKPVDPKISSPSASVIDLTDEDDKSQKKQQTPTKMVVSKGITVPLRTTPMRVNATTGFRLTTSQGKVSPITSVVPSSTQQVMYVVQSSPQNVLASSMGGSKAVLVNFQPTNGVLTSTLNGSAVSVIPKQSNTIQLKTMAAPKPIQTNKIMKTANKHPAPLPSPPVVRVNTDKSLKPIPPKPHLTIKKTDTGIILQWKMPYELDMYELIASYQLYAYQETSALPSTDMWRKVGDVKALALPMACTLTQFADKNKYYFAVRPVDIHRRIGMFSEPEEISL